MSLRIVVAAVDGQRRSTGDVELTVEVHAGSPVRSQVSSIADRRRGAAFGER